MGLEVIYIGAHLNLEMYMGLVRVCKLNYNLLDGSDRKSVV